MVALKSLAQLSLSRPSSQSSTPRSPSSPPLAHNSSQITTRQTNNDDYYLSDDQLVSTGRVKSAGPTARSSSTDLSMLFTHSSSANLSWAPQEDPSVPPSASVLSPVPRSSLATRQHILMAPTPTVACGHTIQPTPHTSGAHRPLLSTLLSVSARASPNPSRPISVDISATPAAPTPKTQLQLLEASYVSKVGTRLKEVVNKIFPHNVEGELAFAGRMAPRPVAASEFGEALKHELSVSSSDSYISRAILRTAVIPALTIYIGRLEPLLLVPTMSTQLEPKALYYVPRNVKEVDTCLPLVLRYNIQVVKSAWSVRTAVEEICNEFSGWDEIHGTLSKKVWVVEGLRGFLEKLDAIVHRFMEPYLVEIKALVMSRIAVFRTRTVIGGGAEQGGLPLSVKGVPLASCSGRTASPSSKFGTSASRASSSPAPISSQHTSELVAELGVMLEGIRKLFMVTLACGNDSKKWMVSVASQAVWKAMLAFASRPAAGFPPCSVSALGGEGVQQLDTAAIRSARHILRGGIKHQSCHDLRDSRPEYQAHREIAAQVKAFEGVVQRFVKGIAGLNKGAKRANEGSDCVYCRLGFSVDHDDDEGGQGNLVKEAMDEALIALEAFQVVLLGLLNPPQVLLSLRSFTCPLAPSNSQQQTTIGTDNQGCQTLKRAIEELPPLIFLHLLASRIIGLRLPHEIWGLTWKQYDEKLQGFLTGEIWVQSVGLEMWKELKRLLKVGNEVPNEKDSLGASTLQSAVNSVSSAIGVSNVASGGIGHSGHYLGDFEVLLEKSCALLL